MAAKQPKQKDKNEEWILAVVINFQADKNRFHYQNYENNFGKLTLSIHLSRYHVEDVDQDEFGQRQ